VRAAPFAPGRVALLPSVGPMRRSTAARGVALAGFLGCLAVAVWVAQVPLRPPVVVGPVVPRASWAALLAFTVGCTAATVGLVTAERPADLPLSIRALRGVAVLARLTAGAIAAYALLLTCLLDLGSEYYLVSPASAAGCRVLADQGSYGVDLWIVPPGALVAQDADASFGYPVLPEGRVDVDWDGTHATASLLDDRGRVLQTGELDCVARRQPVSVMG
jgi:hypothetical protein